MQTSAKKVVKGEHVETNRLTGDGSTQTLRELHQTALGFWAKINQGDTGSISSIHLMKVTDLIMQGLTMLQNTLPGGNTIETKNLIDALLVLIKEVTDRKLSLPNSQGSLTKALENKDAAAVPAEMEGNETGNKRYYLEGEYKGTYLTHREAQCLIHLAQGNSAKRVAKILGLSHRTVEFYASRLKEKFNCRTTSQLTYKAVSLGLLQNNVGAAQAVC